MTTVRNPVATICVPSPALRSLIKVKDEAIKKLLTIVIVGMENT